MDRLPPSFFFLIYFIFGVFLQRIGGSIFYLLIIFSISLFFIKNKYYFLIPLFLFFLMLGFSLSKNSIPEFKYFTGFKVERVKGVVEDMEEKEKSKEVIFKPDKERERILLILPKNSKIKIGDLILIENLYIFPIEGENVYKFWDKDIILWGKIEYYKILGRNLSFLNFLRIEIKNYIKILLSLTSPRVSSFLSAVILGERGTLTKEMKNLFIDTGTAHILAISGFHITLLISFFTFFFNSKRLGLILSFLLFFYAFIIGNKPPVLRAVGMYFYNILAKNLIREEDTLNSFFSVCLISLIFSPLNIFNISFQLSYLATLGLILTPSFKVSPIPKYYRNLWKSSLWLFVFLTPFNIYFFKRIPMLSFIGNFFSIPIFQMILFLSFLFLLLGIFPISYLLLPIIEFLTNILFLGLKLIIINYKISLMISLILILLPFMWGRRNELLGI